MKLKVSNTYPQERAKNLGAVKVATREAIGAPPDIWENLTGKGYTIWHCGCGFVWGEKLMEGLGRPYHDRGAVGYFNGLDAQPKWTIVPPQRRELAKCPDWDNLMRKKTRRR
jgi:hypothetical protein